MRIVQLSDIHLSKENLTDLKNYYREALIADLIQFSKDAPVDILLISGDLIDKGGQSFGGEDPYAIFEKELLNPITDKLKLSKERVLFIPGNHDIERSLIAENIENELSTKLNCKMANNMLETMGSKFDDNNNRIKKFKEFEKHYHLKNPGYLYSNNESLYTMEVNGKRIGFVLVNDSWRCSSKLKKEQHFIGSNQLFNAKQHFEKENTVLNIAVFHHPLEDLNNNEAAIIDNILKSYDFSFAIFGHSHSHKFQELFSTNGGYIALRGRSAFNDTGEEKADFQPGYNILDINIENEMFVLTGRKFIKSNGFRFDYDVDSMPGGYFSGRFSKSVVQTKPRSERKNSGGVLQHGSSKINSHVISEIQRVFDAVEQELKELLTTEDLQYFLLQCVGVDSHLNSFSGLIQKIEEANTDVKLFVGELTKRLIPIADTFRKIGLQFFYPIPSSETEEEFYLQPNGILTEILLFGFKKGIMRGNDPNPIYDAFGVSIHFPEVKELLRKCMLLLYRNIILKSLFIPLNQICSSQTLETGKSLDSII
ncbi:Calcineurin-like phosphoesterase [Chitinophaga jiangningensis]|uniref:Calcineurin-like phosphoesterase n=1 Tax=Chitinophaga jiangningensis TaxID=1419482 RepID=A0A1M7A2V9_9BACT|nr:metallophosphoesterase [Chitinophaga jiangningensis]SHL37092.1 Calcineurin-like phosphoesterase [Chitinophaga jiangningensis]